MKILKLCSLVSLGLLFVVAMSFKPVKSLKGTWEYEGGIYNNKAEGPPKRLPPGKKIWHSQLSGVYNSKRDKNRKI